MTKQERQAKREAAKQLLIDSVKKIQSSDDFRNVLNIFASLHSYSFGNCCLIAAQKPNATAVAGYKAWQKLGRQVRKGEKGIAILAPIIVKDKDDENNKKLVGYRSVYVFDISQTDGPAINVEEARKLEGNGEELDAIWHSLVEYAISIGCSVSTRDAGSANGYFVPKTREIVIAPNDRAQMVKTLAHEIAHAELGHGSEDDKTPRDLGEMQAESVAYLVCEAVGLDSSCYSFAYVAHWAMNKADELVAAVEKACKVADRIVTGLEA